MLKANMNRLRESVAFCLAATVLYQIFFFTEANLLLSYDYTLFHKFGFTYLKKSLLAGELPYWNPHIALGCRLRPMASRASSTR